MIAVLASAVSHPFARKKARPRGYPDGARSLVGATGFPILDF